MSLSLKLKNSVLADKLPAPSQLEDGEIALNWSEAGPYLTCKDTAGKVRRLNSFWVNSQPPSSPTPGVPWIDISGNNPVLKVWVSDAQRWAILSSVNGDILPITTDDIEDEAVTTAKIAANAVTSDRLANGAVSTDALADQAVTGLKLADQAVDSNKLATGAVQTSNLADASVTSAKLGAASVKSAALAPSAVVTAALADASVTTGKIAAQAIISSLIANGAVGTAQLAPSAVQTGNLADGAVSSDKLADGSIKGTKLADGGVGFAALDPSAIQASTKPWTPSDTTLATTAAVQAQLDADPGKPVDTDHIKDLAVTTSKLADQAVTTSKIKPGAVTFATLDKAAVVTSAQTWSSSDVKVPTIAAVQAQIDAIPERPIGTNQIEDGAVTNPKLAADAVGQDNIQQGAVDLTKIDPSSVLTGTETWANVDTQWPTAAAVQKFVTNLPKGPINTGDLKDKAVTGAKIADGAVGNLQLGAASVSFSNLSPGTVLKSTDTWQSSDVTIPSAGATNARVNALISQQVIQTSNIADLAITTSKLALGAVTNPILGQGAVQFDNLNEGLVSASTESWSASDTQIPTTLAVTKYFQTFPVPIIDTANLADNAVTTAKIAPEAVVNDRIRKGTIQFDRLSADAINLSSDPWVTSDTVVPTNKSVQLRLDTTVENLQIATDQLDDFAVTTEKLGNSAVTTEKLADDAVTNDKLAPSAVKIENLNGALLNTSNEDFNNSDKVIPTCATVKKELAKELANFAITTDLIADEAVTTAKLAPLAVTTEKLASGSVTFGKISTNAIITSAETWDSTDTTFATSAAINSHVQYRLTNWIVNTPQIGDLQVTTEKIADQAVTTTQIADLAVGTNQIAERSVTPIKLDREYIWGVATPTHLGGVKVGRGLACTPDGVLSITGGPGTGEVDEIIPGAGISVDSTNPAYPIVSTKVASTTEIGAVSIDPNGGLKVTPEGALSLNGSLGGVQSVKAGGGITVDDTDAANPTVSVKTGTSLIVNADGSLDINATAGQGIVFNSGSNSGTNASGIVVAAAPATTTTLGAIKVGSNLSVTPDGTLNAQTGSPSIEICQGYTNTYTVKASDLNKTVIFKDNTTSYSGLILDGSVSCAIGTTIKVMCSTGTTSLILPINGALVDSGYPSGNGRQIPTTITSVGDPTSPQYADVVFIGNKTWLLRGPQLELGYPYIEYAGLVDGKPSPGSIQVKCSASGEDTIRLWYLQYTCKDNSTQNPEPPRVVRLNKNTTSYTFTGLTEGKLYEISTQYIYNDGSSGDPFKTRECVNPQSVRAGTSKPSAPLNVKVRGHRGARAFITFDYPDTGAPWDYIEATVKSADGSTVLADWTRVCNFNQRDGSPDYPFYFIQFWPTNTKVIGDNTQVWIRLRKDGVTNPIGDASAMFLVNWDSNMQTPDFEVVTQRGSSAATLKWLSPEDGYDAPDCLWSVTVNQGEGVVDMRSVAWGSNQTMFSLNYRQTYTAKFTAQTYGRSGPTISKTFTIPSPF